MDKFWKFINSPIIVVLIALSVWPILLAYSGVYAMKIGVSQMVSAVKSEILNPMNAIGSAQKEADKEKLKMIDSIKFENISFGTSTWPGKQKIIGTIKNNNSKGVKDLQTTVSYYDSNGKLMDVDNQWLHNVGNISANNQADFTFDHDVCSMKEKDDEKCKNNFADSVKIKISSFDITD